MHILIAPDSFKDSLSARDAARAIATGVRRALPDAKITERPLGDGGEGTLDAVLAATGAEARQAKAQDPLGREVSATWGWIASRRTAIVELAEASGLQRLSRAERNACTTTTYGVGQLIKEALDAGAEHLILTLGGSATNDGGSGMMMALGARFLDDDDTPIPPGGASLAQLARIDTSGLDERLSRLTVEAAVDVDNPLCGTRGASAVFGPQKGATPAQVEQLDQALSHLADIAAKTFTMDQRDTPGAGAAGGMGYAALTFLNATLRPGIALVMEQVGCLEVMERADLVITGEGQLDGQSLSGKTPIGVARAARDRGIPAVALVGRLGEGWQAVFNEGINSAFALADGPMTLDEALPRTAELLADRAESVIRLWQVSHAR